MTKMSDMLDLPAPQKILNTHKRSDTPFFCVLIIMAALATLAFLAGRQGLKMGHDWQNAFKGTASLQIYDVAPRDRSIVTKRVISRLDDYFPSLKIDNMSLEDMQDRLTLWIGENESLDDLPLPLFFTLSGKNDINVEQLKDWLSPLDLSFDIYDHREEKRRYQTVGRSLSHSSFLGLALILIASSLISAFATQASMRSFQQTLKVIYNAGASRAFVTRLFFARFFRLSLKGAILGVILGLCLAVIWYVFVVGRNGIFQMQFFNAVDMIGLVSLTVIFTLCCTLTSCLMAWQSPRNTGLSQ